MISAIKIPFAVNHYLSNVFLPKTYYSVDEFFTKFKIRQIFNHYFTTSYKFYGQEDKPV